MRRARHRRSSKPNTTAMMPGCKIPLALYLIKLRVRKGYRVYEALVETPTQN